MKTTTDWYMTDMERMFLAEWLTQFNGYVILLDTKLNDLEQYGLKWNAKTERLSYMSESVEVPVRDREFFNRALLSRGQGGSFVEPGKWRGVWALDVASAILALAQGFPDLTPAIPDRILRYKTIITILRPATPITSVEGIVGRVHG